MYKIITMSQEPCVYLDKNNINYDNGGNIYVNYTNLPSLFNKERIFCMFKCDVQYMQKIVFEKYLGYKIIKSGKGFFNESKLNLYWIEIAPKTEKELMIRDNNVCKNFARQLFRQQSLRNNDKLIVGKKFREPLNYQTQDIVIASTSVQHRYLMEFGGKIVRVVMKR